MSYREAHDVGAERRDADRDPPVLASLLLLATLPPVQLDVPATAPCELASRLPTEFAKEGLRITTQAPYRVTVSQEGPALLFRVSDRKGRLLVFRDLVLKLDDCEVVPHTLALLLRTALTALPAQGEDPARPPGESARSAPRSELVAPQPTPGAPAIGRPDASTDEAEHVAAGVASAPHPTDAGGSDGPATDDDSAAGLVRAREVGAAGRPAPTDRMVARVTPIDAGMRASAADLSQLRSPSASVTLSGETHDDGGVPDGTGDPQSSAQVVGAPPVRDVSSPEAAIDAGAAVASAPTSSSARNEVARSIGILAAGGGTLDLSGTPVAQGAASVDWGFREPWGVALELGLDSRRSVEAAPGRIGVSVYWAELSIRRGLITLDALTGLYAVLGVRGLLMQAAATGFTVSRGEVFLVSGGLRAAVDWRQRIWRGLFAVARVGGLALVRPEVLFVSGVDRVLLLPAWSAFLHLGLGMRFD